MLFRSINHVSAYTVLGTEVASAEKRGISLSEL